MVCIIAYLLVISFGIKGTNVSYNQNMPQATITLNVSWQCNFKFHYYFLQVNSQCPASIPHVVYVTSDCLPGKRMEVTLDEKYELKMNLSHNDEENCNMTMCSGIKNISVSLSKSNKTGLHNKCKVHELFTAIGVGMK